jgi:hypothetical protein
MDLERRDDDVIEELIEDAVNSSLRVFIERQEEEVQPTATYGVICTDAVGSLDANSGGLSKCRRTDKSRQ